MPVIVETENNPRSHGNPGVCGLLLCGHCSAQFEATGSSNRHVCVLKDTVKEASMVHSRQQSLLGKQSVHRCVLGYRKAEELGKICSHQCQRTRAPGRNLVKAASIFPSLCSKPLSLPCGWLILPSPSVFSERETALTVQSLPVRVILTLAMVVCLQFSTVIADFIDFFPFPWFFNSVL